MPQINPKAYRRSRRRHHRRTWQQRFDSVTWLGWIYMAMILAVISLCLIGFGGSQ